MTALDTPVLPMVTPADLFPGSRELVKARLTDINRSNIEHFHLQNRAWKDCGVWVDCNLVSLTRQLGTEVVPNVAVPN